MQKKLKISFNSQIILGFTVICFAAYLLDAITKGMTNDLIFSVYRSSLLKPFTYVRLIGY